MIIDTSLWHWPQWTIIILYSVSLLVSCSIHGDPMVDPGTKLPRKYNAFHALRNFALIFFILIAGGFFK